MVVYVPLGYLHVPSYSYLSSPLGGCGLWVVLKTTACCYEYRYLYFFQTPRDILTNTHKHSHKHTTKEFTGFWGCIALTLLGSGVVLKLTMNMLIFFTYTQYYYYWFLDWGGLMQGMQQPQISGWHSLLPFFKHTDWDSKTYNIHTTKELSGFFVLAVLLSHTYIAAQGGGSVTQTLYILLHYRLCHCDHAGQT